MKKSSIKALLLMLSITLLSATCSSDDEGINNTNNDAAIQAVENAVESGTWIITYFFDTDHEETNNFSGYNFTFGNNGVLTASNGTNTYNGTWSVTDSSSSDDSSGDDDIDFNIFFSTPPDFAELSDDWDIVLNASTKIELIDISGGNGGTDNLTFEKN